MSPRLSVVVPFYGVEDYIGECLESIRSQSLRDIEVILVDDGSPDGSALVAQKFVDQDSRFRIVAQPNAGLGPARNTGTREAVGEFLTFVDSDDLVTAFGFERMIRTLDETGSSFIGGNAKRFNNSSGVRQSWSHRLPFRATRLATHIDELPVLARDRMVWNKVYRRAFWDEFGYEFPAIRYEDYPVTLRAHLDAVTVDALSEPVYYWRERESGDSITQQAFRYDNLLDRVQSAVMVLKVVDGQRRAVRDQVYFALAESDMVTILQAFATVPDGEAQALLDLGRDFGARLGEDVIARRAPFDLIQYRALLAGDVELLRELATFRGGGGFDGAARGQRSTRLPRRLEYPYPGLGSPSVPRELYRVPRHEVTLRSSVTDLTWVEEGLRIRGTAEVRHVPTTASTPIRVEAGSSEGWHTLAVRRFDALDSHGDHAPVGIEVVLGRDQLSALAAATTGNVRVKVTVGSGRSAKQGYLRNPRAGSPAWPAGSWVDERTWAQPATTSRGELVVTALRDAWHLVDVDTDGTDLLITASVPRAVTRASVLVPGGAYAADLTLTASCTTAGGTTTLTARLPAADLLRGLRHNDPFLQTSNRAVSIDTGESVDTLVWSAAPTTVGVLSRDRHVIRLTRSPANRVNLVEGLVRLSADSVTVMGEGDDAVIEVSGRTWGADEDVRLSWRQFRPNSDDYIEVPIEQQVGDHAWLATARVADLLTTEVEHLPGATALSTTADWTLFFTARDAATTAVLTEPFLSSLLPVTVSRGTHHGLIRPRADTLHLQVTEQA